MKIKCPYCKKEITTDNTFSGGMIFCDFCNHNFFLQIKRSTFPHYLVYAILIIICVLLGYGCIKWNQRYNGFLADEKTKEDNWVTEKKQLETRIESIVAENKEELDKLNKIIATHETTIQQQTEKDSLENRNYQKTIDALERTKDKLLVENKNLLNENEQLTNQLDNTKPEKPNTAIQQKDNSKTTVSKIQEKTLDMLPGVYYDLRRPAKDRDTILKAPPKSQKYNAQKTTPDSTEIKEYLSILNKFVLGNWTHGFDANGFPVYSDMQQYYRYPLRAYSSVFYQKAIKSTSVMEQFQDENSSAFGWFSIHSGYIVAPFTGNFRFVGYGDDALVVRFNQQLVLDYGVFSLSLGKQLSGPEDCFEQKKQGRPLLTEKGLYSDKLEVHFPDSYDGRGAAIGLPISVTKGKVYPIEILSSDIGGDVFMITLFVEHLDSNGKPLKDNPKKLPLFRTSSKLPNHPSTTNLPDYDENSPIWNVVDSKGKSIPFPTPTTANMNNSIFSPMASDLMEKKQTSFGNVTISRGTSTTKNSSENKPESSPSRIIKTPFGSTIVYENNDTQSEGTSRTPSATISIPKINPKENEVNVELPNGLKLTLVKVEAGTFEMSAKDGQNRSGEVPHRVTLKRDFYIGQTEVTQAQWKAVMGANPSKFKGDELPVEQVNWSDAKEFCEKLNDLYAGKLPKGFKFTLPTETQWEYASRGGKKSKGFVYSGSNSINEVAWYMGNSDHKTHPVAQKKANELGLYDMSGNVDEWCLDDWVRDSNKLTPEFTRGNDGSDSSRMRRGGSWNASDFNCRSADRGSNIPTNPNDRFHALGFRVVLVSTSN